MPSNITLSHWVYIYMYIFLFFKTMFGFHLKIFCSCWCLRQQGCGNKNTKYLSCQDQGFVRVLKLVNFLKVFSLSLIWTTDQRLMIWSTSLKFKQIKSLTQAKSAIFKAYSPYSYILPAALTARVEDILCSNCGWKAH